MVELLWKTESGILNRCLMLVIVYHGTLHGFQAGQVMGINSLEAKLIHNMEAMSDEILYEIFLSLHEDYDALY